LVFAYAPCISPPVTTLSSTSSATRWITRPVIVLTALVAASAALRSWLAWKHTTPRYFPDEYIYAALGRSIAHGHLEIRGQFSHFPALLEPLLAAPLWGLFSTETAYKLLQVENAAAASLVAIPIYLLARWLGLRRLHCYLCALYGLLLPALALIPLTIADLIAYPLALGALAVAVRAIDQPSTRLQIAFLVLASLATLARTQYLVLVPAYLVAAIIMERRAAIRRHRVAFFAVVPVAIAAAIALASFYSGVIHITRLDWGFVRWFFLQSFLLTLEAGVILVPGAVAGVLRPSERRHRAFALVAATYTVLLLAEASVYAADIEHFKERYVFTLLPLVPIAFGLYLQRGRPYSRVVIGLAVAIVIAAARLPISSYAVSSLKTDSQFLYGVGWLESKIGYGTAALIIALLATAAAAYAVLVAFKGDRGVAISTGMIVAIAASAGAISVDLSFTQSLRSALPNDLTWIDTAAKGPVTAVATPASSQGDLFVALYWNSSIEREVLLAGAYATDTFSTPDLRVGRNGELLNTKGDLLFDNTGTTGSFSHAAVIGQAQGLTLWKPDGPPRFRMLIEHHFLDQWLGPSGRIRVWPANRDAHAGAKISFALSLPSMWKKQVHMHLGDQVFVIKPGSEKTITCGNPSGPIDLRFSSSDFVFDSGFRALSVILTKIRVSDLTTARAASGKGSCSAVPSA
jgi:hypothetical protein